MPLILFAIAFPIDAPWQFAHGVLALLMRYLEWVAELPVATWTPHAPIAWTVGVATAGVLWMLAPRGIPGRCIGVVWMLPLALLLPPPVPVGGAQVTVLDVGQGLAVFVATATHALVYDTGPRFNDTVDAGGRIVAPFLRAAGVARLDMLIVSHADTDHSGGAASLLRAVPVAALLSSLPPDHPLVAQAKRTAPSRAAWRTRRGNGIASRSRCCILARSTTAMLRERATISRACCASKPKAAACCSPATSRRAAKTTCCSACHR